METGKNIARMYAADRLLWRKGNALTKDSHSWSDDGKLPMTMQ